MTQDYQMVPDYKLQVTGGMISVTVHLVVQLQLLVMVTGIMYLHHQVHLQSVMVQKISNI
jgi:hypothetical protein